MSQQQTGTGTPQDNSSSEQTSQQQKAIKMLLNEDGLPGEDKLNEKGEITNDDGSIIETLDTAFHQAPGMIHGHSVAGSNRADYYEAQKDGKSDAEEEIEYMRSQKK